ncbi:helix-turn-helix transcriptional regulator [Streptomyces camponoticapitis]|uniref:Helix-turn-helix transcriptional regulator n=1 Tax=Streptomyces camponoticapitis TaxID=1616125 RepID=A0ABQ2EU86_9ACTN|nr:LuxR family transcriptional regulator [Streptomyces camponoticapitis]GGK24963.1 helix-turn-helix transcriptional regulator [Streptomyces camponoticapitis]
MSAFVPPSPSYPLRGRTAELESVLDEARRAERTGSRLVVVDGDPGIGKTQFLRVVRQQLKSGGFAVGAAAAGEGDRTTPLASLGTALRAGSRVPLLSAEDFASLLPLVEQPLWLVEQLASLLRRSSDVRPLLIALDDFQWADPLSAFALRTLPARLAGAPILWFLASRPVAAGPTDQVVGMATEADVPVLRIDLGALRRDAILEIARDRLGRDIEPVLAGHLLEADGVPFLAVHIAEGLLQPGSDDKEGAGLPAGLVAGIRRRIAPTSDLCRALLRAGAVLGSSFPLRDVAHLLSEAVIRLTAPLEEALSAGLLTDEGGQIRFSHDLLRRAVYEDIPPSVRTELHKKAVDRLLSDKRGAAEAAPHVLASAEPGDSAAVEVLRRAAFEILDTMSVTSAIFIRQAYDLVREDTVLRDRLGRDVVKVLLHARQYAAAETFAGDLLRVGLAPSTEAEVRLSLAPHMWLAGRNADVHAFARDVPYAPEALRERLAAYRGWSAGTPLEAPVDHLAAAVTAAAHAQSHVADGGYTAALRGYRTALRLNAAVSPTEVGRLPNASLHIRVLVLRAVLGEPSGVLRELDAAVDDLHLGLDSWDSAQFAVARSQVLVAVGRLSDAADSAARGLRLAKEIGDPVIEPEARHVLGWVALLRGERATARKHLARSPGSNRALPVLAALAADFEGLPEAAPRLLRAAAETALPWREEFLLQAAISAHHAADGETLRAAVASLTDLAGQNPEAADISAAAALARGLREQNLDEARDALATSPRLLLRARAEEEWGLAAMSNDKNAALEAWKNALAQYQQAGAVGPAARVRRHLHASGVRSRTRRAASRPSSGWESLTLAERRVALLIAQGHTNRSAATELVVSPSTVGTHLRSVFAKLGISSRVHLTRFVLTLE